MIKGIGGCWGYGIRDQFASDLGIINYAEKKMDEVMEPFHVQYEKRMEYLRQQVV